MIGRSDKCDLVLSTRSVSRRHCAIVFNATSVLVRDLDSSNGTFVDETKADAANPLMLWHHSVLQVGKYHFRLSIRSVATNEPLVPVKEDFSDREVAPVKSSDEADSVTETLMTELDALASRLDAPGKDVDAENESGETSETVLIDDRLLPGNSDGDKQEGESRDFTSKAIEDKEGEDKEGANKEEPGKDVEGSVEGSVEDSKVEPQKLPAHLRPKGPRDSQDAASQALKNFFTR